MSIQIISFRQFSLVFYCVFLQIKHVLFCFLVLPPPMRKALLIIKFLIFLYGFFCFSFQFLSIFIIFYEPHFFLFYNLFFYIGNDYNEIASNHQGQRGSAQIFSIIETYNLRVKIPSFCGINDKRLEVEYQK